MSTNPLEQAHKEAIKFSQSLGTLFARAGTLNNPRGHVLMVYRNSRRALRQALRKGALNGSIPEIFIGLRRAVQAEVFGLLASAEDLGTQSFRRQVEAYGAEFISQMPGQYITPGLNAIMAGVDRQITVAQSLLAAGTEEELIIGDEAGERQGVLQPSSVVRDTAQWLTTVAVLAFLSLAGSGTATVNNRPVEFQKQAIAALDEKTTDCCLKVHGQIQPLKGKFHLTGDPHFAEHMEAGPFHWWCRTSVALYLPEFDYGLTQQLRESADTILAERAAGRSGFRHPASALA